MWVPCNSADVKNKATQPANAASGLVIRPAVTVVFIMARIIKELEEAARRGCEQRQGQLTSVPLCAGYTSASVEIHRKENAIGGVKKRVANLRDRS